MHQVEEIETKLNSRDDQEALREQLFEQFYEVALERYGRGSAQARSFAEFLTDSVYRRAGTTS
jgi:hypothetical protein